ncbi:amino acid ABC transporter ATP-binding protein [Paraburkholderia sediminicola]|uniref:amino acid ABC transporter ATP-binding protein n=1 Tax=Paraburkholderia sediminicola TaxID=458836 RepID=UPI0038BDA4AD
MATPIIDIKGLHKRFGELHVLRGVDLQVNKGDRIAIIGSSGSGKSTMLRCLNFMETPSAGQILIDGELVGREKGKNVGGEVEMRYSESELSEVRKRVGMVFQQFNLFPHMTVLQNVMEGLTRVRKIPKAEAREKALKQLNKVGLGEKVDVYPGRLSGGQQQRVAIARALAMEPEVLLFDEPTSSLDPELVGEVLNVIRELADEGRTMLLVTHELGFAYHFANRVIFFADGVFHEIGTPQEVLKNPQRERTQKFLERFTAFSF